MTPVDWKWAVSPDKQQHRERVALIREISIEMTSVVDERDTGLRDRGNGGDGDIAKALSLNISSGGLLLLMERSLEVERVLRIHMPTPVNQVTTPTLAEVRWVRRVPFGGYSPPSFVGLKFLF